MPIIMGMLAARLRIDQNAVRILRGRKQFRKTAARRTHGNGVAGRWGASPRGVAHAELRPSRRSYWFARRELLLRKNSHSTSVASSLLVIGPTMLSGKVRWPPGQ